MTTQTIDTTDSKIKTDSRLVLSTFTVRIVYAMAAIAGIWGLACLIGGLSTAGGIGELINGFISAVTGR